MTLYQYEREENAQELIGSLRRANNPEVRKRAAKMLGRLPDHEDRDDMVRALAKAADEEEGKVAAAAIDALDELGGDALEELLERMAGVDLQSGGADWKKAKAFVRALDAEIPELRMAAANALGDLGEADAVPPLTERFDDPDPRVRARAARACGQIEDPRATDSLVGLLTDPTAGVRRGAANALGRIGNRQALEALLGLYDDEDERVRRTADEGSPSASTSGSTGLSLLKLPKARTAIRRTAVYALVALLANVPTEQSHRIRETVVERLSATDDTTVVTPLVEILRESTQTAQRRNTAWLLGRVMDDPENRDAVDALVAALQDGEEMTRQFAATSIAEIGGSHARRELLAIAEDGDADSDVRGQALFTLGRVGDEETANRLQSLLDSTEDEQVRQKTFSALSKLGGHPGN